MDEGFAGLLHDFQDEAAPLAEAVEHDMLGLEDRWRAGHDDAEAQRRIKSALHTIKGNAAMMGLRPIQQIAHQLEDVAAVYAARAEVRNETTSALMLRGTEVMRRLIADCGGTMDEAAADSFCHDAAEYVVNPSVRSTTTRAAGQAAAAEATETVPADVDEERERALLASGDRIQVDFRTLDDLLELVAETIVGNSALLDIQRRLERTYGESGDLSAFEQSVSAELKVSRRIQDVLIRMRLVPIGGLFRRYHRFTRELSRQRSQPLRLVIQGGETTVDKGIVDRLADPLLHLVRNAVAHGIESAGERQQAGKSAEGVVTLSAAALGDRVVVAVADDGAGIDHDAIAIKARRLGYDTGRMSDEDLRQLIFQPGFSTAAQVSQLAGRGVGLDVVLAAVRALGGTLDVATTRGQGTRFIMTLPLSMCVSRGLLLGIDNEIYIVQATSVEDNLMVTPGLLHEINQRGVMSWRGTLLHVLDGGALLKTRRRGAARRFCVVIGSGTKRCGVLVDQLLGYQDLVIRPLDEMLGREPVVSGASVMAGGKVALVLDPTRVVAARPQVSRPPAPPAVSEEAPS